jgi:hypothetical protein
MTPIVTVPLSTSHGMPASACYHHTLLQLTANRQLGDSDAATAAQGCALLWI